MIIIDKSQKESEVDLREVCFISQTSKSITFALRDKKIVWNYYSSSACKIFKDKIYALLMKDGAVDVNNKDENQAIDDLDYYIEVEQSLHNLEEGELLNFMSTEIKKVDSKREELEQKSFQLEEKFDTDFVDEDGLDKMLRTYSTFLFLWNERN